MDAYEEEQRKAFYIKVAKYAGIAAAVLIVLCLYFFAPLYFWILVGIVGIVVFVLAAIIQKR
ncbi:hypothetical protein T231_00600 [Tannerella sp. oral taxon BU063 isolate Cell 6/7/9]|uniref:Uncharacterized protein n=1 Tax=Tannerella sp. oral taxon BU063 isolate Cell 6/7/9 TaxID=1411021 RepID=W2CYY3_9BACT|nr:hypothetical protein T231_00600 [Tannerella sp. oral taxon BU063 isolate Cell 6/7/9]